YAAIRVIGMLRMLPFLFRNYHAAAVLLQGTHPFFVTRVVKASTKLHWIRSDLKGSDANGYAVARFKKSLHLINHFVCVSNTARDSLIREIPEAESRASVIYNILDVEAMIAKLHNATDPFLPRRSDEVRVLSVCRLSDQSKAIFRMAHVCRALLARGYNFRWYIVGDGPDKEKLLALISDLGIENTMILLGKMHNPFPAYLYTDLVAVLSYYEGLCGVINEAKVVGKAVIATEVSGVSEQLTHGKNGWVVRNDQQSIVEAMANLIASPELLANITNKDYPFEITDDSKKIDKLEHLFNGNFCETHAK
ncbi:MAG: glycosyltransferase, partial [Methylotenera sp.]